MQTDTQSHWQVFDTKIQECADQIQKTGGSLAKVGEVLAQSMEARQSLESGTFVVDSPSWMECKKYVEETDLWLYESMQCLTKMDDSIIGIFNQLRQIINQQIKMVLNKTTEWKRAQRLAILGAPSEAVVPGLKSLAQCYEKTERAIELLSSLIDQYSVNIGNWCHLSPVTTPEHTERANECGQLRTYVQTRKLLLVQKSFIVFEQPPIIVRRSATSGISRTTKGSKVPFDLELRVLAGETCGLRGCSLEVELLLISEKQAHDIMKKTLDPLQDNLSTPGTLLGPRVILQAPSDQTDGQMSAVFSLVRVQSMNKRNEDDTDALYHVLFRTKPFQTGRSDVSHPRFWVISLPFAVLSNAHRQDKYTRARMFWQMSFKITDETSLAALTHSGKDGNEVRWEEFAQALDLWFKNTVHCNEGLSIHYQYIADKLGVPSNPGSLVSWDAFYKRKTGETQLTFWEWFCPIADYLSKMPMYWDSGLIRGFASGLTAEHLLSQATLPSMVLRFSERNPGKMVVSYIIPHENVMAHVLFDESENKALLEKTLGECIQLAEDLHHIQYILPSNKHVSELFALDSLTGQRSAEPTPNRSGYIKPRVALVWRRDPPIPPECLMNTSMDSSGYEYTANSIRTTPSHSECISDVELYTDYFQNNIVADDLADLLSQENGTMWSTGTGTGTITSMGGAN